MNIEGQSILHSATIIILTEALNVKKKVDERGSLTLICESASTKKEPPPKTIYEGGGEFGGWVWGTLPHVGMTLKPGH